MILLRHIVAASSILLVLLSTPAVVEGTNDCAEVCPLSYLWESEKEWYRQKTCEYDKYMKKGVNINRDAYCVCNLFGYNCDGCGDLCPWGRWMTEDDEENEDKCADFHSFTSLSAEGKRTSLAEKYCLDADQVLFARIFTKFFSTRYWKFLRAWISPRSNRISKMLAVLIKFLRVTCSTNRTLMWIILRFAKTNSNTLMLCRRGIRKARNKKRRRKEETGSTEKDGTLSLKKETKRNETKRIRKVWDGTGH